jgi:hypothetical protein
MLKFLHDGKNGSENKNKMKAQQFLLLNNPLLMMILPQTRNTSHHDHKQLLRFLDNLTTHSHQFCYIRTEA